jgi:hypothetical protein|tara:strand:- start:1055 stop:1447 length:393 start_codon:yes stop_codon:yes gene_type:complete
MTKINVITPPDILHNQATSFLLISPSTEIRNDFQKFLETATTSLNVYLYAPEKEEDMDIAWLLAIAKIADYTILDLDYMEISDKKFASYILSIPNTFYLTKDDVTPYNKINLNRVYDLNWLGDITIENEK